MSDKAYGEAKPESIAAIIEYATARGVRNARVNFHKYKFWELLGEGRDHRGCPLVWRVADELHIGGGCGNSNQKQLIHPDRVVLPPKPWVMVMQKGTPMLGDQTYPSEGDKPKESNRAKQQRMLEELVGAIEILPDVIENLAEQPIEALEPFAQRLILATVILQQIEAKVYEYNNGPDGDADDDDETEVFEPTVDGELSEEAKSAAIAGLAGAASGN